MGQQKKIPDYYFLQVQVYRLEASNGIMGVRKGDYCIGFVHQDSLLSVYIYIYMYCYMYKRKTAYANDTFFKT